MYADRIVDEPDEIEHVIEGDDRMKDESDKENDNDKDKNAENDKDRDKAKVKKKLGPRVILNVTRLKGPRGIGIMESFFSDIKLYGKGREREDLDLVMLRLEHWSHRLIPPMKFDDCLKKIEKLGSKKEVSNYLKRIRLGMEENDDLQDVLMEDAPDSPPPPPEDPFDLLLTSSSVPARTVNTDMTAEQREQMLRNRLIAEERRAARIKKAQEMRDKFQAKHTMSQTENSQVVEREDERLLGDKCDENEKYGHDMQSDVVTTEFELNKMIIEMETNGNLKENKNKSSSFDRRNENKSIVQMTGKQSHNAVLAEEKSEHQLENKQSYSETTRAVDETEKNTVVKVHSNSADTSVGSEIQLDNMNLNKEQLSNEGISNQHDIIMETRTNVLPKCDNQGTDLLVGSGNEDSILVQRNEDLMEEKHEEIHESSLDDLKT